MYTGLILLPWVILFGFSGMMFNHPDWLGPVRIVAHKSGSQVEKTTGFAPLDGRSLAEEVVASLNKDAGAIPDAPAYTLAKGSPAKIEGAMTFTTETETGRASITLVPHTAQARVQRFVESGAKQDNPPFHNDRVSIPGFDADQVQASAEKLLRDMDMEPTSPLEASTRGGAELRFQVVSTADDRKWNVTYNLASESLTGRATASSSGMSFYSAVTRLHKTHHYPESMSARWLWTLLADATGFTMVFWGVSGLIMWWQIKPTRVIGVSSLSVAAVVAVFIFSGTLNQMNFGPARTRGGGGGGGGGGGPRNAAEAPAKPGNQEAARPQAPKADS